MRPVLLVVVLVAAMVSVPACKKAEKAEDKGAGAPAAMGKGDGGAGQGAGQAGTEEEGSRKKGTEGNEEKGTEEKGTHGEGGDRSAKAGPDEADVVGQITDEEVMGPGELSPERCKARLDAEEARLQKEVVPIMMAEAESMAVIREWVEKCYKLLETGEANFSKASLAAFWEEYQSCVKQIQAPKAERDPECVAYVTSDPTACNRINDKETRARCLDTVNMRGYERTLVDWAKSGFSQEFCTKLPPGGPGSGLDPVMCETVAKTGKCGGAPPMFSRLCKAAEAGARGEDCGSAFPEGSMECKWLRIVKAPDRVELCKKAVQSREVTMFPEVCDMLVNTDAFTNRCSKAPTPPPEAAAAQGEDQQCRLVEALRNGTSDCTGLFAPDSRECVLLKSLRSHVGADSNLCASLPSERTQTRCKTFNSDKVEDCELKTSEAWGTGARDDTPCRRLLVQKKLLPASEGRVEIRMTLVNPFNNPAHCQVVVSIKGREGSSNQNLQVELKDAEIKYQSIFFVGLSSPIVDIEPQCTWDRVIPPPAT